MSENRLRPHLLALALYTLLALALTWPLAARFTTHVPGDGIDDPALAWNLWWIKARLVEQLNFDIFHVDWMFHPVDINLAFYTLTPLNGLLSVPLQSASSLIIASNLLLLSTFVLGGYGTFLLALHVIGDVRGGDGKSGANPQSPPLPISQLFLPALLAGLIYAFASSKLFYASLGQFNIASSHWLPFCVLYVLRVGRSVERRQPARQTYRNATLAALFLTLQAWSELTYASFLLIFIGIHFIWTLAQLTIGNSPLTIDNSTPLRLRQVQATGAGHLFLAHLLMGALFTLGIAPFLAAMLPDLLREGDFFASGGGFADRYSADLLGYLVPTRLHPLLGDWVATLPFLNDKAQHIYIGYSALILAALGIVFLWRRRKSAAVYWSLNLLLFWLLTLGPNLRVAGRDLPIPGPFALVSQLPFFSGNRYPSRYSVVVMLCVAVLAAFGVRYCVLLIAYWQRRRGRMPISSTQCALSTILIATLFLSEHLSTPLPLNFSQSPSIYRDLAALPDSNDSDGVLLELPTGWRNGARVLGRSSELIMMQQWYQSKHGRPRLGGNTSRNPAHKFQYFTDAPLIGDLIALMNADDAQIGAEVDAQRDELIARNRLIAPRVLDFLDVDYITLHLDEATPQLVDFVEQALPVEQIDEWRGQNWRGESSAIRLYKVIGEQEAAWQVDLADPSATLHLAEGWSSVALDGVRHAVRAEANLLVDVPDEGGTILISQAILSSDAPTTIVGAFKSRPSLIPAFAGIHARPSMDSRLRGNDKLRTLGLPIEVRLNNAPLESKIENNQLLLAIPPGVATARVDRLRLTFDEPIAQASGLLVRSAGEQVGDFAQIFVDGVDLSPNTRGYNLAALSPEGAVLDVAAFDTSGERDWTVERAAAELNAMAAWLNSWPDGTIVAGAVADEASVQLSREELAVEAQAAIDALARYGVASDLRARLRWSHAFVGTAGSAPGEAIEELSLLGPATVAIGDLPAESPQLWGSVETVEFTPLSHAE